MSASRHLGMSDLDLAWAVEAGDPEAWQEVRRRFTPVALLLARRICARIGHRGRRCPGLGCDRAFTWVALDLLDRFAGHDAGGGRRRASPLIVTWGRGAPAGGGFAAYVLGPAGQGQRGMLTEGRRAWNRARGLRVRANPSRDMARRGERLYRQLTGGGELAASARRLGLRRPGAIWRWSEALFVDACETGLEDPIDLPRVARYLLGGDPSDEVLRLLGPLALAVDRMLAVHWPDWYDAHLSRPRQHTRRSLRLDDLGELRLDDLGEAVPYPS
jgi:hypothetical protein